MRILVLMGLLSVASVLSASCGESASPLSATATPSPTPTGTASAVAPAKATSTTTTVAPAPSKATATAVSTQAAATATPGQTVTSTSTATVFYANCDAARAAGVAPIMRGQPGYRTALDRDGDGIACD